MPIKVAVIQQEGNPGQVNANRAKALSYAAQALDQGANVILFHEELLVGYVQNLRELAEPLDGPTTQAFRRILQGSESLIIYGLTERQGENCYISAPVVSRDGVIANYRKTHLWWASPGLRHEPGHYRAGDRLVTFDYRGHRCGIMICYDGDFPEMTRSYANLGCTTVFWMNHRGQRGHAEVKDLAWRNSMIMCVSCCCGLSESGKPCRGGSNITDASGALLGEIWDREGLIVQDIFPENVLELRQANPWFRGQRPDVYHYG